MLGIQSSKHQDPSKYYAKEVESFMIGKLAWQFCDQGHDSILYAREVYNFRMALGLLCKVDIGSYIVLANVRRQMQMVHVRWDEPVDCWRSKIEDSIESV